MQKTILITGATDGIGFETAKQLVEKGHQVIVHGRNQEKLALVQKQLEGIAGGGKILGYRADLSSLEEVKSFADQLEADLDSLDVLINNAGIFVTNAEPTVDGFDVRIAVNAIAPYYLSKRLAPLIGQGGRIVNLSSAAQAPVNPEVLKGWVALTDNAAYAQSKLLLTMWSKVMGETLGGSGPMVVSVNPKSFLGSKMVKDAYGVAGGDLRDGADILIRAALSEEFENASGLYFDNDIGRFANPHADALDRVKVLPLISLLDDSIAKFL